MSTDTTSQRKTVFVGFHMEPDHAKSLYDKAAELGIPVAQLLRHLVLDRTDNLTNVEYTPQSNGRRKRFA